MYDISSDIPYICILHMYIHMYEICMHILTLCIVSHTYVEIDEHCCLPSGRHGCPEHTVLGIAVNLNVRYDGTWVYSCGGWIARDVLIGVRGTVRVITDSPADARAGRGPGLVPARPAPTPHERVQFEDPATCQCPWFALSVNTPVLEMSALLGAEAIT
jgi:hypothetical protein